MNDVYQFCLFFFCLAEILLRVLGAIDGPSSEKQTILCSLQLLTVGLVSSLSLLEEIMKLITLLSALVITAMAVVTIASPSISASDPNCPIEGWQYNVRETGTTCEEAKADLYNRLVNMAETACGGFLQSYSITISPECSCSCSSGLYTATGGVRYCCSEL